MKSLHIIFLSLRRHRLFPVLRLLLYSTLLIFQSTSRNGFQTSKKRIQFTKHTNRKYIRRSFPSNKSIILQQSVGATRTLSLSHIRNQQQFNVTLTYLYVYTYKHIEDTNTHGKNSIQWQKKKKTSNFIGKRT